MKYLCHSIKKALAGQLAGPQGDAQGKVMAHTLQLGMGFERAQQIVEEEANTLIVAIKNAQYG